MSEKILSPDGLSFWDGEDWVSMEQNDTPKSEKILSPDGLNYLDEGRWIPLSLDQNSKNNTNEHEIFTSNVNFSDIELMGVNIKYILSIAGLFALVVLYFSFSSQTYTLQYEVSAVRSGEEFTLYYEYENPEGDSIGGGLLFSTVPDCIDVTLCQHTFEVDFEYNEPFEASFTITCAGCENNPPNVCIETFVDFYSIGVACGMSGNPNDGYNFALITDNVIVNNQVMKNV